MSGILPAFDPWDAWYSSSFPCGQALPSSHRSYPRPDQQANPSSLPPSVIVDDEEHYKVEAILDSHIFYCKLQHQVKWKGYAMAIRMLPRSQQEYGGISVVLSEISELDFRVITGNLID